MNLIIFRETSDFQETYSKSLKALVLPIILHKKFVDGLERCKVRKNVGAAKKMLIEFSDNLKVYTNKDIYGKIHNEYASEVLLVANVKVSYLEVLNFYFISCFVDE